MVCNFDNARSNDRAIDRTHGSDNSVVGIVVPRVVVLLLLLPLLLPISWFNADDAKEDDNDAVGARYIPKLFPPATYSCTMYQYCC